MTEEAKRALALQIMEQERLRSQSPLDAARERINVSLRRSEERRQSYASLAQKGHTWDELQEAYSSAYEQGKRDMVAFHLTFFYCSLALALREVFDFSSSAITIPHPSVLPPRNRRNIRASERSSVVYRAFQNRGTGANTVTGSVSISAADMGHFAIDLGRMKA